MDGGRPDDPVSSAAGAPTPEEVSASLERILADREAGLSNRSARLLRYIVNETFQGRGGEIRGTSIALDVFDRGADFDPQTDPIVRTEARRLRQALAAYYVGPGAQDPVVISVPKGGYVPVFSRRAENKGAGDARPLADPVSEPADQEASVATSPISKTGADKRWRSPPLRWLVAGVAITVAVFGLLLRPDLLGVSTSPTRAAPAVVIVPFEVVGGTDETSALSTGLAAKLVSDLMRFPDFRLYTFSDGERWDASLAAETRGSEPGATFAVRGLVQRQDDELSVTVRLTDAFDDRVVWSDSYLRRLEPDALVDLQSEISGEIATAIGQGYGAIRSATAERMAVVAGAGMSSYACVLGAYAYRHTNRFDLYPKTRECLEAAVIQDPDYAEAWALLAFLRLDAGRFGYEARTLEERSTRFAEAKAAALKALALQPKSVQATLALSTIEHYAGRFEESQRLGREALALNPNDPDALAQFGWRLAARGELQEGVTYLQRAIDRSARPPWWYYQAIALERLVAGDPLGMLAAAERAALDGSSVSDSLLAIAYAGVGDQQAAGEALQRMGEKWPLLGRDPATAYSLHNLREDMVDALVQGLRKAGWRPEEASTAETAASKQ